MSTVVLYRQPTGYVPVRQAVQFPPKMDGAQERPSPPHSESVPMGRDMAVSAFVLLVLDFESGIVVLRRSEGPVFGIAALSAVHKS